MGELMYQTAAFVIMIIAVGLFTAAYYERKKTKYSFSLMTGCLIASAISIGLLSRAEDLKGEQVKKYFMEDRKISCVFDDRGTLSVTKEHYTIFGDVIQHNTELFGTTIDRCSVEN